MRPLLLKSPEASVGRKSGAHSALPIARAYSRHAGLSPQSGSGRNLLLYGEPARPPFGLVGHADRPLARRGSPGARPRAPFRFDARVVLPDHMHCLWTLPEDDADFPSRWRNQDRICEMSDYRRVTIANHDQPRRTGHLAASVLGAHDTRRSGLCGSHGLHAFQPGETRCRRAPGGLAAFVVSSVRRRRAVSRRVEGRQR